MSTSMRLFLNLLVAGACVAALGSAARAADDDAVELREYYSGNGLLQRGMFDLAAAEYRKFLDRQPDHEKAPVAKYGLAVCLYRTGKLDAAAKELAALAGAPKFEFAAEVAVMLAQCRLQKGQHAAAAELLAKLLKDQPDHALAADASALLVEALYRDGRHDDAIAQARAFNSRFAESPARERVTLLHGLALMARSDWPAAADRFAELLRAFPAGASAEQAELLLAQCHDQRGANDDAARAYQAVLARAGGRFAADALYGLAGVTLRQGKPQDALALLDRLTKEHAESPLRCGAMLLRGRAALALDKPDQAVQAFAAIGDCPDLADQAAYWTAKAQLKRGDFAGAAEALSRAIQSHPKSPLLAEMRYDRGVALAQKGDDAAAIAAIEEFRKQHAKHEMQPDALQLLATLEHRRKRYDQSLALCRAFLEAYPAHALAAATEFLVAENLFLSGKVGDAAQAWRAWLERHPDDPQAGAATFRLGAALYRGEKFDEAITPLSRAAALAEGNPALRESLLLLGDIYLQRSEWKLAEAQLARYLEAADAPAADEAMLKLGIARLRQGQHAAAIECFDRLLSAHPKSPHRVHACFERGQALLAIGKGDEAQAAFERVVQDDAEGRFRPHALAHLGSIALRKKDYAAAAKRFADASGGDGDEALAATALLQRGQALLAAGEFAEAEKSLREFTQRFLKHERLAAARAHLAIALARQDKPAEALKAIDAADQPEADLDAGLRAALRYEKAWCLRRLNRNADAAAAYRGLLEVGAAGGAQRLFAALELAELEAAAGRCKEALALLEPLQGSEGEFASLPPDAQARLLYRVGVCRFEFGDHAKSAEALEKMLSIAPEHTLAPSACFFAGEALFKLGKYESAAKHLARITERFRKDEAYGPALLRLGECLAALQNWPKSEEVFAQFLREHPGSEQWYQAQFGVGWARENLKRYDEAVTAYRQVVERHKGPTAARAQFQVGECLYAQKRFEDAAAELLKVDILYAYPEWSAAALYEAGRCFEELNKTAEARTQYEAVRARYGETRWAELAAQRLAGLASAAPPGRGSE